MEIHVCSAASFRKGERRLIKAGIRNIAVYNVRGQLYAIDNACYHHGGPLLNGDIEDMGGHPCVTCPWHSYKIALDTGEGLYHGLDVSAGPNAKPQAVLKSKGPKQRTHQVHIRDGEVYCYVDPSAGKYESDTYAEMPIANRENATPAGGPGAMGGGRSGLHSSSADIGGGGGGIVDQNRSGAVAFGGGGSSTSPKTAPPPQLLARLVRVRRAIACDSSTRPTVCTFTFDKVGEVARKRLTPGEWVELRLPGKGSVTRRWTVTHVGAGPGGWFSITVKDMEARSLGGCRWLFSKLRPPVGEAQPKQPDSDDGDQPKPAVAPALSYETLWGRQPSGEPLHDVANREDHIVEVVSSGGEFTLAKLRERINRRGGRLLMISAGIGITPMYAAVSTHANDSFATVSGPPLHIAHLHWERHLRHFAFGPELLSVHRQFSAGNVKEDPFSYRLQLYSTAPQDQWNPEDATVAEALVGAGGEMPPVGRLTDEHVQSALAALYGGTAPASVSVVVMLCGPEALMEDASMTLMECGVDPNDIVLEEF